jgi:hypothetical protein
MFPVRKLSMSAIEAEAVGNCTARMAGKGGWTAGMKPRWEA